MLEAVITVVVLTAVLLGLACGGGGSRPHRPKPRPRPPWSTPKRTLGVVVKCTKCEITWVIEACYDPREHTLCPQHQKDAIMPIKEIPTEIPAEEYLRGKVTGITTDAEGMTTGYIYEAVEPFDFSKWPIPLAALREDAKTHPKESLAVKPEPDNLNVTLGH